MSVVAIVHYRTGVCIRWCWFQAGLIGRVVTGKVELAYVYVGAGSKPG